MDVGGETAPGLCGDQQISGNLNISLFKTVLDCKSPLGAESRIILVIIEHLFCILWYCAAHIGPALKSACFMASYIRLTSRLV